MGCESTVSRVLRVPSESQPLDGRDHLRAQRFGTSTRLPQLAIWFVLVRFYCTHRPLPELEPHISQVHLVDSVHCDLCMGS